MRERERKKERRGREGGREGRREGEGERGRGGERKEEEHNSVPVYMHNVH